ncbi:adenosylmethionine decarboxylase [Candidatus Falkowbacteria bacterium]|nr:adenosylmethionine decarboxylase [Candidatus Falkowbacteria bacterium]
MDSLGRQLVVELKDCNADLLNDLEFVEKVMLEAAQAAGATTVAHSFHPFIPHGISGMVIIAESHLAIHTWPEYKYAAIDIFTCGNTVNPDIAAQYLIDKFKCQDPSILELKRGVILVGGNLKFKAET